MISLKTLFSPLKNFKQTLKNRYFLKRMFSYQKVINLLYEMEKKSFFFVTFHRPATPAFEKGKKNTHLKRDTFQWTWI
jgi:hypothetical protein